MWKPWPWQHCVVNATQAHSNGISFLTRPILFILHNFLLNVQAPSWRSLITFERHHDFVDNWLRRRVFRAHGAKLKAEAPAGG